MELTFNPIGAPAYGTAFRTYIATIPLKDLGTESKTLPLFVVPKGSTIVAVKLVCTEYSDGAGTVTVAPYGITAAGAVGTAITDGELYKTKTYAVTTKVGDLLAKEATAIGTQMTADVVIQAVAASVTTAATKGALQLEVVTL
jgi:hypothetical protein